MCPVELVHRLSDRGRYNFSAAAVWPLRTVNHPRTRSVHCPIFLKVLRAFAPKQTHALRSWANQHNVVPKG